MDAWRQENFDAELDLSNANLSRVDLCGARPIRANLSGADLHGAQLRDVDLRWAYLGGADLRGADLRGARLQGVDLSHANLLAANLSGVDLLAASLSEANLSRATMGNTIIANVDLRTTKGLTEIWHHGPSIIQLHTIQLPQDGSTLHFLRGAGVPDEWIGDYRARMMHPIQYYSLFISYSSKDETLARRLHADLQASGVRCWFAPEDLKIGTKFRQRIDEAIHLQDKLLLLLSEHSIASIWVENEVEAALEKEDR